NSKAGLGYGQNPGPEGKFNVHADGVSKEEKWTEIPYLPLNDARQNNAFGEFTMTNPMGKTYTYAAPTRAQYHSSIRDASDVGCLFGIVYGDGAIETKDNSDAYSFTDYDNNTLRSPKGVQGMIAYHKTSGHSIFFSFGAAGHARRKNSSGNGYGLMRYGSVDTKLSGANSSTNAAFYYRYNNYRPLAYNLPEQKGGVYWLRDFNLATSSTSNNIIAMDFNSGNYMVNELGTQDLYTGSASDACCIRPVHVR
ncbi:MAG: hypothetical protein K2F63_01410, partial [Muribaculaceae bacterium]|nr:hypothetical protein [Muribaculaceae bacterium]